VLICENNFKSSSLRNKIVVIEELHLVHDYPLVSGEI